MGKNEYLLLSCGQWDPRKSKDEIQRAIDSFYVWFALADSLHEAASIVVRSPCLPCGLWYEIRPLEH